MNNSKSTQRPVRNYDLRALLVLFVVIVAYLGGAIYLLVLKALHD
ncbi:MAG: hypothetical protein PVH38_11115 [Gammaproteobacteria bacterium]